MIYGLLFILVLRPYFFFFFKKSWTKNQIPVIVIREINAVPVGRILSDKGRDQA